MTLVFKLKNKQTNKNVREKREIPGQVTEVQQFWTEREEGKKVHEEEVLWLRYEEESLYHCFCLFLPQFNLFEYLFLFFLSLSLHIYTYVWIYSMILNMIYSMYK